MIIALLAMILLAIMFPGFMRAAFGFLAVFVVLAIILAPH